MNIRRRLINLCATGLIALVCTGACECGGGEYDPYFSFRKAPEDRAMAAGDTLSFPVIDVWRMEPLITSQEPSPPPTSVLSEHPEVATATVVNSRVRLEARAPGVTRVILRTDVSTTCTRYMDAAHFDVTVSAR